MWTGSEYVSYVNMRNRRILDLLRKMLRFHCNDAGVYFGEDFQGLGLHPHQPVHIK